MQTQWHVGVTSDLWVWEVCGLGWGKWGVVPVGCPPRLQDAGRHCAGPEHAGAIPPLRLLPSLLHRGRGTAGPQQHPAKPTGA